jgi:hypothetical protein
MEALALDALAFTILWKTAATGAIIVLAGRLAQNAGPVLTSLLVSIPANAGPGFLFISFGATDEFVSRGALTVFAASGAVWVFTTVYVFATRSSGFLISLILAVLFWFGAAWITLSFEDTLLGAGIAIAGGGCFAVIFYRRVRIGPHANNGVAGWRFLILRGLIAGLLVASVSTASPWLGPTNSGMLLSFPTLLALTAWMLSGHYGKDFSAATLQGAQRGLASYMSFAISLHLLSGLIVAWQAVLLSFLLAMMVGSSLAVAFWHTRRAS